MQVSQSGPSLTFRLPHLLSSLGKLSKPVRDERAMLPCLVPLLLAAFIGRPLAASEG